MQPPFKKLHAAKRLLATSVVAFAVLESAAAGAGELPTFEVSSFPVSPVQVSVLGAARVQEQPATPTLMRNGMPASSHQLSVLTPRHTAAAAVKTTVGAAQ